MAEWTLEQADLMHWLRAYDGPRFHAVFSDPPYALISIAKRFGKEGSAPAQEGSDGRYSRLSGGFMGQRWDGFDSLDHYQAWVTEWANLLIEKALFPGAVALFFGGTRTFHRLGTGLELGGFEIIDCLMFLHGQGFPKNHQIPVEGWEGHGTSLKPAWEPVFLCRAPRGSKTFAQLAVEHGTGALNIDGARIAGAVPETSGQGFHNEKLAGQIGRGDPTMTGEAWSNNAGRWPANLVLSHHPDCQKVGETQVKGRTINRFKRGMMPFGNAEGEEYDSEQMPDETVERWACVPECPIRMLDDQAGSKPSARASGNPNEPKRGGETVPLWGMSDGEETWDYRDLGGPSRFFYCSKASRAEKDLGLEDFYWKRTGTGFERITLEEWEKLPKRERARGCIHPTVKPLELLRYLATLVLPPADPEEPRRILVPFSGSGSEVIGAIQAGWDEAVAVEMEPIYNDMAEARIRAAIGML